VDPVIRIRIRIRNTGLTFSGTSHCFHCSDVTGAFILVVYHPHTEEFSSYILSKVELSSKQHLHWNVLLSSFEVDAKGFFRDSNRDLLRKAGTLLLD
jgi:hypothetical protein